MCRGAARSWLLYVAKRGKPAVLLTLREAAAYGARPTDFQDFAVPMDRLIAAQTRLEQALDRLSAALAARREREARLVQDKVALEKMLADRSSESAAASVMAGEIERIRSENVLLRADKSEVADKLDAAIGRLKILIES